MFFYMHAGSLNHGCEAIVRTTLEMTDESVTLFSGNCAEDKAVNLDNLCNIESQGGKRRKINPMFIVCKIIELLFHNPNIKYKYAYKNVLNSVKKGDLYLSIGGDNYCYNANQYLHYVNQSLNKKGAKTALWGCSIEPKILDNESVVDDMRLYSFITARESITYNALKEKGIKNVYLYPDPAFTLKCEKCELPALFNDKKVVGINLSPLVLKLDKTAQNVFSNFKKCVDYILQNTDMNVVLIPHVCKENNDDRAALRKLLNSFPNNSRMHMVNESGKMNCMQLKYIISKCRFLITARTHASIASYSTCVPTLVAGYSVKADGIATDIFGTANNYVVDIHNMKSNDELLSKFRWMESNEMSIVNHLKAIMPDYIAKAAEAKELFNR